MEATRCQPSASATTVTAISSHSCGSITNQTVSTANATSAPRLSTFLPGSISGRGLDPRRQLEERHDRAGEGDRADEDADEHLGVVDAQQVRAGEPGLAPSGRLDVQVAVPADQHRGQADEGVQQRDQLGHAGHLTTRARHRPIAAPIDHRARPAAPSPTPVDVAVERQRDGGDQRDRHAGDAEGVAGLGGLVLGQPGQGQDEQQGGDDVGRLRGGRRRSWRQLSSSREHGEHAAGHREATEDVDAGQQDRHERQRR